MSKTDLDKAEIEQLWRMIAIPDLMRNGFLAVGQELIKRDAEIDRLTAENYKMRDGLEIGKSVLVLLDKALKEIKELEAENKKLQDRPDYSDLNAAVFINSVLEAKLKAKDELLKRAVLYGEEGLTLDEEFGKEILQSLKG